MSAVHFFTCLLSLNYRSFVHCLDSNMESFRNIFLAPMAVIVLFILSADRCTAQYQPPPPAAAVPQQGYGQPHVHHQAAQPGQNLLHDKNRIHDKEHLKEHLGGVLSEPDLGKLSEEEMQFHYFKMHDSDNNNMLDGSELIKSLIHWHGK